MTTDSTPPQEAIFSRTGRAQIIFSTTGRLETVLILTVQCSIIVLHYSVVQTPGSDASKERSRRDSFPKATIFDCSKSHHFRLFQKPPFSIVVCGITPPDDKFQEKIGSEIRRRVCAIFLQTVEITIVYDTVYTALLTTVQLTALILVYQQQQHHPYLSLIHI